MFERVVPDFVPSAASMELAVEAIGYLERWLGATGLTSPADADLVRALLTGLAGQQIANDPGGTRWTSLVDRAIDSLLSPNSEETTPRGKYKSADSAHEDVSR
jgi:hypothetical protein